MTLSRPDGSSRSRDTRSRGADRYDSRDDDRYGNSYHRRENSDFDTRAAERQASAIFNTARAAGMRPRVGMAYILQDDGTVTEESGDRYLENYEGRSGAREHGSSSGRHEGASRHSNNPRRVNHESGSSSRRLEAPSSSSRREDNMQLAVYGDRSSHASSRSSNGHSRSSHGHSVDDRERSGRRDTGSRRH